MVRLKGTPEQRFWPRVKKTKSCWIWIGAKFPSGYGEISVNNRSIRAHRFSYQIHYGPIPDGKIICHRCDNPACVNPDHLFLGTNKDNTQDMIRKKRGLVGEKNPCAKLTLEQVIEIRETNLPQRKIASKYGISQTMVGKIKRGTKWNTL